MRVAVPFALLLFVSLLSWAQEPRNLPILGNEDEPRRPMGPRRELEPPTVPVARPTAADKDADGLDDALEERLLQKFAPVFRFDAREDTFPSTVEDFLAQSVLMFNHAGCRDHIVLGPGELSTRSLVRQTHNFGCEHTRGSTSSTTPIRRVDRWLIEFFYIDLIPCPGDRGICEQRAAAECGADAECRRTAAIRCLANGVNRFVNPCNNWGITRGVRDLSRLKAYAGVAPSTLVPNAIEIRVRLFYPVSTQTKAGFGYHEGDFEGAAVHITRDEQIHTVRYFNHDGPQHTYTTPTRWYHRRPELVPGTQHVNVYVAAESHSSYPFAGEDGRGAIKPTDYHRGNHGFSFPTAGRIVNVGSSRYPFPGFGWLEFSGFWGEHYDAADVPIFGELEGSSPRSPSF